MAKYLLDTNVVLRFSNPSDARLVAIMITCDLDCILTLNPNDFSRITDITVVHPQEILESSEPDS